MKQFRTRKDGRHYQLRQPSAMSLDNFVHLGGQQWKRGRRNYEVKTSRMNMGKNIWREFRDQRGERVASMSQDRDEVTITAPTLKQMSKAMDGKYYEQSYNLWIRRIDFENKGEANVMQWLSEKLGESIASDIMYYLKRDLYRR